MKLKMIAFMVAVALLGLGGLRAPIAAQGDGSGQPGVGTAVPIIGTEGGEVARVTVTEIEDPFEDYDAGTEPERSYHYVLLHIEVENTGNRPYIFDAYGVTLQDAEGFLYQQTFLSRPDDLAVSDPEFTGEEQEAGDTLSGVIGYQVLNGAELVRVVFQPQFDRLIFLADLTVAGAAPPADDTADADATPADDADATNDTADTDATTDVDTNTAAATDTDTTDDTGDDTGTTDDADAADDAGTDDTAVALDLSDEECDDVQIWLDDVTPALETFEDTLNTLFSEDPITPELLLDASAEMADAADVIRDSDPPAALDDAAAALADALDGYADAYADAADAGEDIPLADFQSAIDTAEADAFFEDVSTFADPVLETCEIEF